MRENDFDSVCRSAARECDVKLAMGEDGNAKIQSDIYDRLTLGLVDGHGKGQTNRKLTSHKGDVKIL